MADGPYVLFHHTFRIELRNAPPHAVSDLHKWLSNDRIPYTASIIEPKLISMTFMANDEERIKAWFVENRIRIRTTPLGPQATRALERPDDFISLSEERKWEIDRELGILDWDGSEDT